MGGEILLGGIQLITAALKHRKRKWQSPSGSCGATAAAGTESTAGLKTALQVTLGIGYSPCLIVFTTNGTSPANSSSEQKVDPSSEHPEMTTTQPAAQLQPSEAHMVILIHRLMYAADANLWCVVLATKLLHIYMVLFN